MGTVFRAAASRSRVGKVVFALFAGDAILLASGKPDWAQAERYMPRALVHAVHSVAPPLYDRSPDILWPSALLTAESLAFVALWRWQRFLLFPTAVMIHVLHPTALQSVVGGIDELWSEAGEAYRSARAAMPF